MPSTYIRRTRKPQATRRGKPGRTVRVPKPWWVDPYPWIQGSSIEKMVMAEFVRRGIYFEHTPQRNTIGGYIDPTWEADFLLPQYKIWVEIQGEYFHSRPDAIERDAIRFAAIEASGWRPVFWWEYDIRSRLKDLMDAVPEFYRVDSLRNEGYRRTAGLPFFEGGDGIDHLAGLRKALSKRRKPSGLVSRVRKRRKPK
jgi:very-short-patch-repair endonuclease